MVDTFRSLRTRSRVPLRAAASQSLQLREYRTLGGIQRRARRTRPGPQGAQGGPSTSTAEKTIDLTEDMDSSGSPPPSVEEDDDDDDDYKRRG